MQTEAQVGASHREPAARALAELVAESARAE